MLTALTIAVGAAPAHAAAIDRTVLTWNMQGGGEGGNDPARKWEVLKKPLLSDPEAGRADIALIQEAGPMDVPASAQYQNTMTPQIVNSGAEPINRVEHYTWKVSNQQTYHIYRIDWDTGGHRVNPAIVTRQPADDTVLVGRVSADLRPMLGVRFGDDVYFTLHSDSPNGNDAMALAGRAWNWAQAHTPSPYSIMVGGDFNREPGQLGNLNGLTLHKTGQKTHTGGKELDYALAGTVHQQGETNPVRLAEPGRFSDHSPVLLIPDHACTWSSASATRAGGAPSRDARVAGADQCQDAVVSMGDSYISGEAGRWQGNGFNGQYSAKAREGSSYGTDRTAFNCTGSGNDEKCEHDPKRVYGNTGEGMEQCHRSDVAPIKSLGDTLGIPQERRFNIACSGATTADVLSRTFKGEKPQVEQLADLTRQYHVKYVVLSIGGNDLGFSKIAQDCVLGYEANRPCSDKGRDEITRKLGKVRDAVTTTVEAIQKTLSDAGQAHAKIILQGYPNPVPSSLNVRYENKAWMREMSGGCPLTDKDVDWLHYEVVPGLNDHLASVAQVRNTIFLNPQSALAGHQLCGQGADQAHENNTLGNAPDAGVTEWVRWIPGLADALPWTQGETQEAAHPNAFGQQALGTCLRKTLEATEDLSKGYFACYGAPDMGPADVRVSEKKPRASVIEGETHRMVLRSAGSGDLVEVDWSGDGSYVRGEEERNSDKQAWDVTAYKPAGPTVQQYSDEPQPVLADITVKHGDTALANSEDGKWAQLAKGGRNGLTTWALSPPNANGAMQYLYLRQDGDRRKVAGCLTQNPQVMTDEDRKSWLTVEPCDLGAHQDWWFEEPGPLPNPRPAPSGWEQRGERQIVSDQHGTCVDKGRLGSVSLRQCEAGTADQQWQPTAQIAASPSGVAGTTANGAPAGALAVAGTRTQTPPAPTANGTFFLVNSTSNDCLRHYPTSEWVTAGPCTQTPDQQWTWQGRTLRAADSGQCMVPGSDESLTMTDCVTVPDAFKGGIDPQDTGRVGLRSATGLAMELPGGDTTAGTKIVGADPVPKQDRQKWDLHADAGPDGVWRLAPRLIDSRHLSYNVIDKVAALMDAVADNKGEQWRLERIGGGWYRVVNDLDGTVLTATRPGEPLELKERSNNLGQWWRFDAAPHCSC
ncbi:endonuclease/exonuclease/phosphatase family protein [Streptomyces sp. NPDC087917]|uniref:endonuclease/exonuclease/phosphatase family protein n=1 Tax=Streptomyces sp. NPDC087917 TaxID=3155060 RepID=UPI00341E6306